MATPVLNPIETAEREIRRDREDLERLKRRYPGYDLLPAANGTSAPAAVSDRPVTPVRPSLNAIEQAVLTTVDSKPLLEWTSRQVIAKIRETVSFRLPEDDAAAMNYVGIALASLTEKGRIIRSHEGRGRDPHRYLSLQTEKEAPSEEKAS